MKEYKHRIVNSLTFRIIMPLSAVVIFTGLGLYMFVLTAVSDFANKHIEDSFSEISNDVYGILDQNLNELFRKRQAAYEKAVRIQKGIAIGMVEDFLKEKDIKGSLLNEEGKNLLSAGNIPANVSKEIDLDMKEYEVSSLELDGKKYYASHFHFEPWGWRIVLLKDAAAYSDLLNKVRRIYRITFAIFIIAIAFSLYFLDRHIRHPISSIITPMRKGGQPEYKGIYEFEFLSENISALTESLRHETQILNNLYQIAVSKKGVDFFDEVTKTVNEIFGLYSMIWKINPDNETAGVVSMHYEGEIKNIEKVPLKQIMCKRGHAGTAKDICIIENDAYKKFPAEYLTAVKADLYLCCNIFDRKDSFIGIVSAFGGKRELTELDVKTFQAIGQIVGSEFERLNEEREKEALREQLFQVQKLDAIGTLAGGIAHDFNNMLQGILGYAAYLKMKVPVENPMYEPLSVIEHTAERAADLTKKLLGFARRGKYVIEPLSLNAVVGDVITIITRTFGKKIKTETSLAPDLWTVEGDKGQLEHVIMNLCINSKDAMPEGGTLRIETSNAEITKETKSYRYMTEGKYAVLKVLDTGKGMDEETKRRIFEPFFTTKEMGKGTGMGLPMAYGVVKNHHGFITVESAPGKGTIFTIYLPATEKRAEKEATVSRLPHKGTGSILVIDDEEVIRNVARDILRELGYDVLLASSGKEGVEVYAGKKSAIDLVILDLIMPEMGGRETFSRLKEINPDVKVLISSGYGKDSHEEVILDAGEAGFIQKPYNINAIAEIIKEVLSTA